MTRAIWLSWVIIAAMVLAGLAVAALEGGVK